MPGAADNTASLLDAELVLPRRREADPDEDSVTLAAEAALTLLERGTVRPGVLVLATSEPPYDEGGSVQPLAELLGLAGPLVALELTASERDGLTAIRVAADNLRSSWPDERERRDQGELIVSEVDRLTRLFHNILEMARIDAGAVVNDARWVAPSAC